MSDFLFLYRNGEAQQRSPEQMQETMKKWTKWLQDLGEKGALKDPGQPLERTGKIVRGHRTVTDGPFAEAKDIVGGFSIVTARDLSHAAELSSGCPIFDVGGAVEVRPIMKM
jgi:hypothetical protein